jgi:hypothetical protein
MIHIRNLKYKQEWPIRRVEELEVVRDRHQYLTLSMDVVYDGKSAEKIEAFLAAYREVLKEAYIEEQQDGQGEQPAAVQQGERAGIQEEVHEGVRAEGRVTLQLEDGVRYEGQGPGGEE